MTPAGLAEAIAEAVIDATEEQKGVVMFASEDAAAEGISDALAVTPLGMKTAIDERAASDQEVEVGTENEKFITPASIKAILDEIRGAIESLDDRVKKLEPTETPQPEHEPSEPGTDSDSVAEDVTQSNSQESTNGN